MRVLIMVLTAAAACAAPTFGQAFNGSGFLHHNDGLVTESLGRLGDRVVGE